MNKKAIAFLAASILIISVAWLFTAQEPEDPIGPPGLMTDELWIRLSENSGIALSISNSTTSVSRGTLMIKHEEKWRRIYLEPGPAHFKLIK